MRPLKELTDRAWDVGLWTSNEVLAARGQSPLTTEERREVTALLEWLEPYANGAADAQDAPAEEQARMQEFVDARGGPCGLDHLGLGALFESKARTFTSGLRRPPGNALADYLRSRGMQ